MDRGASFPIEKQNLVVLGICLLPVIIFLLITLVPAIAENIALSKTIPQEEAHLKEIKKNTQTGKQIDQFLAIIKSLPLSGRKQVEPLQANQVEKVLEDLQKSAGSAGTAVMNIRPLFDETEKKSGELSISAVFLGDFQNLYTIMMEILQFEYLNRIISMEFDSENKGLRMEITFAVNMS